MDQIVTKLIGLYSKSKPRKCSNQLLLLGLLGMLCSSLGELNDTELTSQNYGDYLSGIELVGNNSYDYLSDIKENLAVVTCEKDKIILENGTNFLQLSSTAGADCKVTFEFQTDNSFTKLSMLEKGTEDVTPTTLNVQYGPNMRMNLLLNRDIYMEVHKFVIFWKSVSDFKISCTELPHKEEIIECSGTGSFDSKVVSYRQNSLITVFLNMENDQINSAFEINITELVLDIHAGDFLLVGKGNSTTALEDSSTVIINPRLKKPLNFLVIGNDAFVTLVCGLSSKDETKFSFNFSATGDRPSTPPPIPTIPVAISSSQLQSIALCFDQVTNPSLTNCINFMDKENLHNFKTAVAYYAQEFVSDKKIQLPTSGGVSASQIEMECYSSKIKSHDKTFLNVYIVSPLDKHRSILLLPQLREFFILYRFSIAERLKSPYHVMPCESHPNYWIWYWGSAALFALCVIGLSIHWYWSNRQLLLQRRAMRKPLTLDMEDHNHINPAFDPDGTDRASVDISTTVLSENDYDKADHEIMTSEIGETSNMCQQAQLFKRMPGESQIGRNRVQSTRHYIPLNQSEILTVPATNILNEQDSIKDESLREEIPPLFDRQISIPLTSITEHNDDHELDEEVAYDQEKKINNTHL